MSPKEVSPLKKAVELIRAGKAERARPMLVEFLRAESNNAQAWFLLSYALDDPQRKQYALMQALKADPNFERADLRLRQLRGEPAPAQNPKPKPIAAPPPKPAAAQEPMPVIPATPSPFDLPMATELSFEDAFRNEIEPVQSGEPPAKKASPVLLRAVGIVALLALFAVLFIYSRDFFAGLVAARPTATDVETFRSLPATWTPSGPTATVDVPEPTATIDGVSSLGQLDQAALNRIALISEQVDLVRALPSPGSVPPLLLNEAEALPLLNGLFADNVLARRESDESVLRALGLLDATQTLNDYLLNSYVDPYGAIFATDPARVYFVGSDFSNLAAYAYARQYGRAMVEDNFGQQINVAENCSTRSDSCRALRALIQGDWELTGEQWLSAYASAAMFEEVDAAKPGPFQVQTEPPVAFALADLKFMSEAGLNFVSTIFDLGGWEQVNAMYSALPTTSEQILHPEKYLAGEEAESVDGPIIGTALGSDWNLQARGSMGEWLTYALLAAGSNPDARVEDATAREAAAGWGGDNFQVYLREGDATAVVVEHWLMESDAEAIDLRDAMTAYLTARFAAEPSAQGTDSCWQPEGQIHCVIMDGSHVVWVQTPAEPALLQAIVATFDF